MKLEKMIDEEMFVFVAPDGSAQLPTMAPDFATCIAMGELMASRGIGQHPAELFAKGFMILPVKITMTQNGDENTAFSKFKKTRKP